MFSAATVNPVFLENMRQLWRYDPRLAQRIDELPLEAGLDVQPSKAGPMTAAASTADGRRLYLHSRYDPRREALDFCKSLEERDAYAVVLSGLGLGYHVKALIEVLGEETVVLVSEPDLVTVKTALEHTDLSKELGSSRVAFLTSLEKNVLHERLHRHYAVLLLGTTLAVPPAAREHNAEFHAACRQAVLDYAAFSRMSLVTLLHNAEITCRNVVNNLPTYVTTPPPEVLRRRFAGHPAILVAAGPSLAKNIDQLRGLRDRAVIIAAQTTLRLLLSKGIRPHFVTSLDFSELSRQFFEGVEIPLDVVLVAEPKATWHVVDVFRGVKGSRGRGIEDPESARAEPDRSRDRLPFTSRSDVKGEGAVPSAGGQDISLVRESLLAPSREGGEQSLVRESVFAPTRRVVLLDNEFARRCIGDDPTRRAPIEAGATVMHLAFYLAQWLGCDPIIFIGQDLAFTGHCYYAPGVTMHRTWYPELGRFAALETKEWERIVRQRTILRKVRDSSGRDIYTDEQMFTYLEQFERDFAKCAARIIDATEGGAYKRGATAMTLREAAEQYCRGSIPAACFPSAEARWYDGSRLRPARAALAARLEELAAFRGLCDETADVLKGLEGLVNEPAKFNRRIVRVDELRTMVQEHETIFRMVRDVSQLAEFQKFAADRRIAGDDVHGGALARRQLQRDRQFVAALLDGGERLRRILEEGLARFDREIELSENV